MIKRQTRPHEYYAVLKGNVDEPTIYSSWGDAHPKLIGCQNVHRSFHTLPEAQDYMKENGVANPKLVIKEGAGDSAPRGKDVVYYAVANGIKPGIYHSWSGKNGAKRQVEGIPDACHRRFRTRAQAEAFIDDWNQSFANVVLKLVREGLVQGRRPRGVSLLINVIQNMSGPTDTNANGPGFEDGLNFEGLKIEDD